MGYLLERTAMNKVRQLMPSVAMCSFFKKQNKTQKNPQNVGLPQLYLSVLTAA